MKNKKRKLVLVLLIFGLCATTLQSQMRNGKFGIGISGSGNMLNSDLPTDQVGLGSSVVLTYSIQNNWGIRSSLGFDVFKGKEQNGNQYSSTAYHGNLAVSYNFMLDKMFNPFIFIGAGFMSYYPQEETNTGFKYLLSGSDVPWTPALTGGFGFDCFLNEFWSITVSAEAGWLFSDNIDNKTIGGNDTFERISIGVHYYLFDKGFMKKMIETSKNRERGKTP